MNIGSDQPVSPQCWVRLSWCREFEIFRREPARTTASNQSSCSYSVRPVFSTTAFCQRRSRPSTRSARAWTPEQRPSRPRPVHGL